MAEAVVTIQNLPSHVLEEIFSYLPDKKVIRMVCKDFCDVINTSKKLVSNYSLNMSQISKLEIEQVNTYYQHLNFRPLRYRDLEVFSNYKRNEHVKSIKFFIAERNYKQYINLAGAILTGFGDLLLDVEIEVFDEYNEYYPPEGYAPAVKEFKNIKSLALNSNIANSVVKTFSKAPNLKKLDIYSNKDDININKWTTWKLEEYCMSLHRAHVDTGEKYMKFIQKHHPTLKVLKLYNPTNILNDIAQKLPHLEVLHLRLDATNFLDDDLPPNHNLKELCLVGSHLTIKLLRKLLKHYPGIEKLYLDIQEFDVQPEFIETNAMHLTTTNESLKYFKILHAKNLKSLTFIDMWTDVEDIEIFSQDILDKIETLTFSFRNCDKIGTILEKFPSLVRLCLTDCEKEKGLSAEAMLQILELKNLKCIEILKESWKMEIAPNDFLLQNGHPKMIIKLYNEQSEMVDGTDNKVTFEYDPEPDPEEEDIDEMIERMSFQNFMRQKYLKWCGFSSDDDPDIPDDLIPDFSHLRF